MPAAWQFERVLGSSGFSDARSSPDLGFLPPAWTFPRVSSHSASLSLNMPARLNDVFGGVVTSVLSITYGLSYAVLIFTGPLAPFLPYGIAATFVSASIAAAVLALCSSFPFAVAGPTVPPRLSARSWPRRWPNT